MNFPDFFQELAFEAEMTLSMIMAFDLACQSMQNGGYPDLIKEIIAKRIILCAGRGEADPVMLAHALSSLGLYSDDAENPRPLPPIDSPVFD